MSLHNFCESTVKEQEEICKLMLELCTKAYQQGLQESATKEIGVWVAIDEYPHEDYECNKCGYVASTFSANINPYTEYKYCPNCGARMVTGK